jgi:hypothetical protein
MRGGIALAAIALLVVTLGVLVGVRGSWLGLKLGPKDGHDLPPIDLERVAVGDLAPDFSLRALTGEVLTLSQFRRQKNVVLVFYRGHW